MSSIHPAVDGDDRDYLIDPVSVAGMVSSLLQIVLALIGPDKAKAALDWETVQAANAAADASKVATDAAALAILHQRGVK